MNQTKSLRASTRYQSQDMAKTILWYFGIMTAVLIVLMIIASLAISRAITTGHFVNEITKELSSDVLTLGGVEETSYLVFFIAGLNMFREDFWFLSQHGVSRRSTFIGHLITVIGGSAVVALGNVLLNTVFKLFGQHLINRLSDAGIGIADGVGSPFEILSFAEVMFDREWNIGTAALLLLLSFVGLMLSISIGYFITILYYRLNTLGKVIVSVGVPVYFSILLPFIDYRFLGNRIADAMAAIADKLSTPLPFTLAQVSAAAVFSFFAWMMMRRASIRRSSSVAS